MLGAVIIAGVAGAAATTTPGPHRMGPAGTGSSAADGIPVSQPPAVVRRPDPPIVKVPLANGTIGPGYQGDDVTRVQQRLTDLGFAPGPIDGQFGSLTKMAVWAFEKLVMKTDREQGQGAGHARDVGPDAGPDRRSTPPAGGVRRAAPHRDLPARAGARRVRRRQADVDQPHLDRRRTASGAKRCTISPGENGNENGTEPLKRGECGNADDARRRVPVQPPGHRGQAREPARRDAQPGVLQLRDRRPRRRQRAAATRPRTAASGSPDDLSEQFSGRSSRSAIWSMCGTA